MLRTILFFTSLTLSFQASSLQAQTLSLPTSQSPFLSQLVNEAKAAAKADYEPLQAIENETLQNLSYQQYRAIRFKGEESIWRGLYPYEAQFFHTGFLYQHPVNIHLIDYKNRVSNLPFSSQYFNYDSPAEHVGNEIKTDVGFAGFRVHYPLNTKKYKDELVAFLGATYFRLVGKHQKYGISARALAIDTAMPEGEEFPYFTDFWLLEPANGKSLIIYAKMDSPSMTGVYKFTLSAEKNTQMDVKAWLFAREDIEKLGLAPVTSMFLYGENTVSKPDDFRPEVHDSDGMILLTNANEQLWRPLNNPNRLRITSLSDSQPKGFGMIQRDIQYGNYLDSEAEYHQRPGLWITPHEGFNDGRLELVEIPANSETHDNIVAYWVNNKPLAENDGLYLHYEIAAVSADPHNYKQATVLRTLQGADILPGEEIDEDNLTRRFIVDFTMPDNLTVSAEDLSAQVTSTAGSISQVRAFTSNFGNEIRATFLFTPENEDSVNDMRLMLTHKNEVISEVWTYVYER